VDGSNHVAARRPSEIRAGILCGYGVDFAAVVLMEVVAVVLMVLVVVVMMAAAAAAGGRRAYARS
jgi:hypothetical protein